MPTEGLRRVVVDVWPFDRSERRKKVGTLVLVRTGDRGLWALMNFMFTLSRREGPNLCLPQMLITRRSPQSCLWVNVAECSVVSCVV